MNYFSSFLTELKSDMAYTQSLIERRSNVIRCEVTACKRLVSKFISNVLNGGTM